MKVLFLTVFAILRVLPSGDTKTDQISGTKITIDRPVDPTIIEMATGLKDALAKGTTKSAQQLSAVDGFFGDATVKILFPPQAQKAEKTLRQLGLNKLCDDLILSLNRAAEDAAKQAEPIFIEAIRQMSFDDVAAILTGPNDAATQYFKRATSAQLTLAFKPVIQNSLNKVGATKYYSDVTKEYNKLPFVKKLDPDISAYATQKAIDGIFIKIALEELNIRKNSDARTSPILRKVFAFADSQLH
jgi:Protein of unknown function (DUF4197)